jgi:histidine triad (HIT) family protein
MDKKQLEEYKKQLMKQIEGFPEDKQQEAKKQIESMNQEQFEEFLNANNMVQKQGQKCIFCSIVFGEMPSTKIAENEKAIAILELNPISKGHTLIIPKEHIEKPEDLPKEVQELVTVVSKKIKNTLKPKEIKIDSKNILGHEIIGLVPIYKDETLESPPKQSTPEELQELQKQLEEKSENKKEEVIKEKNPKKIDAKFLPLRIP